MSLLWPQALLLLVLVPAGLYVYGLIGRRRLAAVGERLGPGARSTPLVDGRQRWRARIPPTFMLLGLVVLTVALARPQGTLDLPRQEGTVILAFDVSGSMAATDVKPSRLAAAQAAAEAFVERQPASVVIGVVAFSDAGVSAQAPTADQATVLAAIKRLKPQKGTSVGRGILASLAAITAAQTRPSNDFYSNRSPSPTPSPTPVPAGTHTSAVVVLMSDGENNESPDPAAAAKASADRGIRVYAVGVGTAAGTTLDLDGFKVHTALEEATLQQIARATDATYFSAADSTGLAAVYDHLDTQLVVKPETIELTPLVAGAAVVLLLLGALGSLVWLGR
ncbi:MAG: VWA domain-containing protein, partial [Candidatus Limnocylindrales bacterium]